MDMRTVRVMMPDAIPGNIIMTVGVKKAASRKKSIMAFSFIKRADIFRRTGICPFTVSGSKLVRKLS